MGGCGEGRVDGRDWNSGDSVVSRNAETRADKVSVRLPTAERRNLSAGTRELPLIPLSSDKSGSLTNRSAISWQQR